PADLVAERSRYLELQEHFRHGYFASVDKDKRILKFHESVPWRLAKRVRLQLALLEKLVNTRPAEVRLAADLLHVSVILLQHGYPIGPLSIPQQRAPVLRGTAVAVLALGN